MRTHICQQYTKAQKKFAINVESQAYSAAMLDLKEIQCYNCKGYGLVQTPL
jgi:hypothetical protein